MVQPVRCDMRFGSPNTIRTLADEYRTTGQGLSQLADELRQSVGSVVPREWKGSAADAFKKLVDDELNVATQAADRARRMAEAAVELAAKLDEARAEYQQAAMIARSGNYYIDDACLVEPMPGFPAAAYDAAAAVEATWRVKEAVLAAGVARTHFLYILNENWNERLRFMLHYNFKSRGGPR